MTYLKKYWNFSGGLAVKTRSFYAGGTGLICDQGTKIPHGPRCSQKLKRKTKQNKNPNTNISRPGHINTVCTTETSFSLVPIFIKSPLHWFLYDSHKWPEFFLQCIPFFLTNSDIFLPYFILLKSVGVKLRAPSAISRPKSLPHLRTQSQTREMTLLENVPGTSLVVQ